MRTGHLMSQRSHVFNSAWLTPKIQSPNETDMQKCRNITKIINYYFVCTNECSRSQSGKSPLYYSVAYTKREVTVTLRATWQSSLLRSSNLLMLKGLESNKIFPACQSEASRKTAWQIYSFASRSTYLLLYCTELLLKHHNDHGKHLFYYIFEEYSAICSCSTYEIALVV